MTEAWNNSKCAVYFYIRFDNKWTSRKIPLDDVLQKTFLRLHYYGIIFINTKYLIIVITFNYVYIDRNIVLYFISLTMALGVKLGVHSKPPPHIPTLHVVLRSFFIYSVNPLFSVPPPLSLYLRFIFCLFCFQPSVKLLVLVWWKQRTKRITYGVCEMTSQKYLASLDQAWLWLSGPSFP